MYKRLVYGNIVERLNEPRTFVQVLSGPRQVGKTTLAHQVRKSLPFPHHYSSADEPMFRNAAWVEQQWEIGRLRANEGKDKDGGLLILDEVQKIPYWSDIVKKLWDEDTALGVNLKVLILGSSSLLIQSGLAENLIGRVELVPVPHWSFKEFKEAFGWTFPQYAFFGSYPGAASLIKDEERWSRYIIESIIETSLARDVLIGARIHKPILLRLIFELACQCSGDVISYQRMLGQLQAPGNVHTLAQYLHLLSKVGFVVGLPKFSLTSLQQKISSPKLQVLNTALTSALSHYTFESAQQNQDFWNRLVKSSIGAYLLNSTVGSKIKVFYWQEGSKEVDFIVEKDGKFIAIGINNNPKKRAMPGLEEFSNQFDPTRKLLVGEGGISFEEFLLTPVDSLF